MGFLYPEIGRARYLVNERKDFWSLSNAHMQVAYRVQHREASPRKHKQFTELLELTTALQY
jgi:hypothetical protein